MFLLVRRYFRRKKTLSLTSTSLGPRPVELLLATRTAVKRSTRENKYCVRRYRPGERGSESGIAECSTGKLGFYMILRLVI